MASYSERFYDEMKDTNLSSARKVSELVIDMVSPRSVVDIGCGTGIWLKAFSEKGVKGIYGYDGAWVKEGMLVIPKDRFEARDLERPIDKICRADLAVCLEVAEHLPRDKAHILVDNLVNASPVVLFSAAIPMQGGSHHVNEQWPDYWEALFSKRGYVPVDCIRRHVWNDPKVSFFYAQNIFIYVDSSKIEAYPRLKKERESGHDRAISLVHPFMYTYYAERWRTIVPILGKLPPSWLHAAKKVLGKLRN